MILLDTNALVWVYWGSDRMGPEAVARIEAAPRSYYSSVSVSELVIKHMLGRIELPGGDRFPDVFAESGLIELPFTSRHANAMREDATLVRHDPFDRMILAQARADDLELLTSDATLLALGHAWVRDASA
ncbi:type II toxin-antitoxin system VapC family toxin [Microbacterium halophytorum]|uniref:type II toxin-antitoxin system VapC family toxin n=1 Tax=Microbacterium halophytorum TaxID=2067568 RepID=UPI00131A1D0D|nr:type II toxin-antitoxin system VapC family toxin [Microbacterium halophytorum]